MFISFEFCQIVSPKEHAFIACHYTLTNPICSTQSISEVLGRKSQVNVIYIDLSKAFSIIDQKLPNK